MPLYDGMTFVMGALETAGTVADDTIEQGAAENAGGVGKMRGQAIAAPQENGPLPGHQPQTETNHPTPVDHHYEHLRAGMSDLFTAPGIAA
jgi:hypothetical protein